ncbi:glutathione S-transferase N-terminal domain-containing protein [Oceanimonas sp. NS1]|uniref:Glutathione S-transferase n=1 Tax=Oceanimonas doudoroffii TaxID=84158 RepID=A0A233RC14_9GAMM|nr:MULTISPECIES: glutathione S-transferase N-terminal domain-containing protein [Oceanimonas]MCT7654239.1 glutathione S-transferase N-terminal domain-containing protein [Oceanimonas sp. NS1]NHI01015.1 Glutathione S-transferase GST-4.5 [Oceanimonas sp. MB9]OXY80929.1 glutathione S-transferase [Oceanimonas doudoroffii]
MKLFYKPGACSLAPHIVLSWLGLPYELEQADTRDPAFLKINYMAAVPVLFTEEMGALYQSSAILRYLARLPEGEHLGPGSDPVLQYQCDYWMSFLNADLYNAFVPYFAPRKYTTDRSDAALQAIKAAVPGRVAPLLQRMDNHLASRTWYMDEHKSIVDACAFGFELWATRVLPEGLNAYPHLARHFQDMKEDEGVRRALDEEGLTV